MKQPNEIKLPALHAEDKARLLIQDTRRPLKAKQAALDNMISRNECLKVMVGGDRIIYKNDAGECSISK